jgi:hypothetical protein
MKIKPLFILFLIILSYGVECKNKIFLVNYFRNKNILESNPSQSSFIEKKINLQNNNQKINPHDDDEADELEEDWEIYGDDRVKTDVGLRKLYRSFRNQHQSGTLTMKTALLQYKEFEKSRKSQSNVAEKRTNMFERINSDEDDPQKKKLEKAGKVFDGLEAAGGCISAFYDTFAGDFCWKRKSSLYPSMCQCGYSFYKGVCYESCPSGSKFSRGECISYADGTRKRMKYVSDTRNAAFLCKSGYKKQNGLCKESCDLYNMVDCGVAACAKDSTTCGMTIFNMIFGVFMAVFQIVIAVMTIGQGGGFFKNVKKFFTDGNFLKKIWNKAKEQAKEALETLTDPEKLNEFMADYLKSVALSNLNLCKEIANELMKRSAKGPQEVPDVPVAEKILTNPVIENLPGGSIASAIYDVTKECNGGSSLDCAKSVMGLIGELDPTGVLGGVLDMAKNFMHPGCDEVDEKESKTEEEEVQED